MAFNRKIKSLDEVLNLYSIDYRETPFPALLQVLLPEVVRADIALIMDKLEYKSSQASIREYIIAPLLKEAWKRYADQLLLWVEKPIAYNGELNGVPDYVISKRSAKGKIFFESPHVAVIEAKKDDFTAGWAQCALEMYTLQKINGQPDLIVYGVVTNGDVWEFASLQQQAFTKYPEIFNLQQIDLLHSALCTILARVSA